MESPKNEKLPFRTQLLYGTGTTLDMWGNWFYPGIAWIVFNIYLKVPAWQVSLALAIRLLMDALSDPLFGWISDNTRSRWGRRRPYLFVGAIASGLALPFLFYISPNWGSTSFFGYDISNYFWWMIGSSAIYMTFVGCFIVPYNSLGNELTPDYNERTNLFSTKFGVQKIPEIGLFAGAIFVTRDWFKDSSTGEIDILKGVFVYCSILGVIMIIVGVNLSIFIKERYYKKLIAKNRSRTRFIDTFSKAISCRPFRDQLIMALAYNIGTSLVATLGFYATIYYVCDGDLALGSEWNFIMGLSSMASGLLGVLTFNVLARKKGKVVSMYVVLLSAICVYFSTWWLYDPDIKWLQTVAAGAIAFTGSGFWMILGSMGPDIIDYDELENGTRSEGTFTACTSWILKAGAVLGTAASGALLSSTGFDESLGSSQSPNTIFSIRAYLAAVPIVGLIISTIALSRYKLSRQSVESIRIKLEDRRGKV